MNENKKHAFIAAKQAGAAYAFATFKSDGPANRYLPPKEKARREKRRKIANRSRRRNRGLGR